jgi:hypothetical protein
LILQKKSDFILVQKIAKKPIIWGKNYANAEKNQLKLKKT